jgi:serine/threonine protein kinase/WD40 repeat protein
MPSSSSERDPLEQLADEFLERFRQGERPALSEYTQRYPQWAERIRKVFPALVVMEGARPDARDTTGGGAARAEGGERCPERVGEYRILREVGRGGMGVVYEAEHAALGRRVALKVLPPFAAQDAKLLERFKREARAAARLHHTNIVPVFEAGQDGETCFYAMQFIQGQGLDQVVEELRRLRDHSTQGSTSADTASAPAAVPNPPSLSQAARALLTGRFELKAASADPTVDAQDALPSRLANGAAAAPAAPGSSPSVVLPGQTDMSAVESDHRHYYDGVARVGVQAAEALAYSHAQGILHRDVKPSNLLLDERGTVWITDFGLAKALTELDHLTYTGDLVGTIRYMAPERFQGNCDVRADVYSLGLTLYELLTLRPTFEGNDRKALLRQVTMDDPPRPRKLVPDVPRDLETIVLKAIAREPERRYQSAAELADDLKRFLEDRPIKARRASAAEKFWRLCRRNPSTAGLVAAAVLLLAVLSVGMPLGWLLWKERNRAEQAERESTVRSHLSQARAFRQSGQPGQHFKCLAEIKKALEFDPSPELRQELRNEAIAALCLPDLEVAKEWDGYPKDSTGFAIDAAFERYAVADKDGNVSVRRVRDDQQLIPLPGFGPCDDYVGLLFSPDGRFLHVKRAHSKRRRLWKLDGTDPVLVIDGQYSAFAFSPDSRRLAASFDDGTVRLLDTETGNEVRRFAAGLGPVTHLSWNPKRPELLVWSSTQWRLIDVDTGECGPIVNANDRSGAWNWIAWHPQGRLFVSCTDRRISLWDARERRMISPSFEFLRPLGGVVEAFNHAGDRLVSNDWGSLWRVWDARTGKEILTQPGRGNFIQFSADDGMLVSYGVPKVRLFRFRPGAEFRSLPHFTAKGRNGYYGPSCLHPNGRLLALGSYEGIALVDLQRLEEVGWLPLPLPTNYPLCFEPGGNALLTNGANGLLRWPVRAEEATSGPWRIDPPEIIHPPQSQSPGGASPGAQVIAIPAGNGAVVVRLNEKRFLRVGPQQDVRNCSVSPDGCWVATGSHGLREGPGAKVWDARTGQHVADLPVGGLCGVCFSPDNKWLVTTSPDSGGCRLWEVGTWRQGPALGASPLETNSPAFRPDGKLLALSGDPGVVHLVVPERGVEVARLTVPEKTRLHPMRFTPDGEKLLADGDVSQMLHVFDLRAIRAGLRELGLDWDDEPLPAASPVPAEPLRVQIDPGSIRKRLDAHRPYSQSQGLHLKRKEAQAPLGFFGATTVGLMASPQGQGPFLAASALIHGKTNEHALAVKLMRHQERPHAVADLPPKEHALALERLRQAVKLDPDYAAPRNDLAWLLLTGPPELRDAKAALAHARKADELSGSDPLYKNILGVALYRNGQYQEAVPVLEKSLPANKGQFAAFDLFFLAMCHHQLGHAAEAKDLFDQASHWFEENRGKLTAHDVEELTAFQTEAREVLGK